MTYTPQHVEAAIAKWQASNDADSGYYFDDEQVEWHHFEEILTESYRDEQGKYRSKFADHVIPGLGTLTGLVVDGGGEGSGEYCELVFQITAPDGAEQIFRKEGYYASFHGTDWDGDLFEVLPVDRVVRFYEKKAGK